MALSKAYGCAAFFCKTLIHRRNLGILNNRQNNPSKRQGALLLDTRQAREYNKTGLTEARI